MRSTSISVRGSRDGSRGVCSARRWLAASSLRRLYVNKLYVCIAALLIVIGSHWFAYRAGWSAHADKINKEYSDRKQKAENRQAKSTSQSQKVRTITETKYKTIYRDVVKYVQDPRRTVCKFDDEYIRLRQSALDADAAVSRDERSGVRIVEKSTDKH